MNKANLGLEMPNKKSRKEKKLLLIQEGLSGANLLRGRALSELSEYLDKHDTEEDDEEEEEKVDLESEGWWGGGERLLERVMKNYRNWVIVLAISPDGENVVSGGRGTSLMVNQMSTGKELFRVVDAHPKDIRGVTYIPDHSGIVSCGGGESDNLKVWSLSLELLQTLAGHIESVNTLAISQSGFLVSGGLKSAMNWSKSGEGGEWARVQVLTDHKDWLLAVCFSPDGKLLATGSQDNTIKVYGFKEGNAILKYTFDNHTGDVLSLSFSPDSTLLSSGSEDRSINFWNPADGSLVKSIDQAHPAAVNSVVYSPNGRVVASGGGGQNIKIWDASTFQLKHTFDSLHTGEVTDLAFTSDSNVLVSSSHDKTVRLTNVAFPTTASNLLEALEKEDPIMVKEAILTLIKLDNLCLLSAALALVRERKFQEATMLLRTVWKLMDEVSEQSGAKRSELSGKMANPLNRL